MSKLSQEEVQSLRSRICHGEQELISTLTPEQFLALLSYDYDTGFAAGKASAQKEILCMLAADGMPPGENCPTAADGGGDGAGDSGRQAGPH